MARISKTCLAVGVAILALSMSLLAADSDRPRVFVSGTDASGGSSAAETTGSLTKVCPQLIITIDRDEADYIVVRDYTEDGPGTKPHKITVFNHDHDLLYSGATRFIGGAVKDTCKAILTDWKQKRDAK